MLNIWEETNKKSLNQSQTSEKKAPFSMYANVIFTRSYLQKKLKVRHYTYTHTVAYFYFLSREGLTVIIQLKK